MSDARASMVAERRTEATVGRRRRGPALFLVLAILLAGALPAGAQIPAQVPAAEGAAIRAVIAGQMEAFGRDAGEEAFAFASPGIRAIFGTAARFMEMVRSGYQPVYRPRAAEFAALLDWDGRLVQPVRVVGPDGVPVVALYDMELQPDGSWRIAGCSLVRQPAGDA